jgi:hypothetical protein
MQQPPDVPSLIPKLPRSCPFKSRRFAASFLTPTLSALSSRPPPAQRWSRSSVGSRYSHASPGLSSSRYTSPWDRSQSPSPSRGRSGRVARSRECTKFEISSRQATLLSTLLWIVVHSTLISLSTTSFASRTRTAISSRACQSARRSSPWRAVQETRQEMSSSPSLSACQ